MSDRIPLPQARRIALAAQGFGRERPEGVTPRHAGAIIARLGLHQIDSVNVLVRAHYLPAFSRLGAYDRGLIDRAAWGPKRERRLFEYWGHEASLLPLEMHPLLRWRMDRANRGEIGWGSLKAFAGERRAEARAVLGRIRSEGPLAASDFDDGRGKGGWWQWGEAKRALEWLFWAGLVTTATRRPSFERLYDLSERVIPAEILALPTPPEADAKRALVAHSAKALGIATEAELRDYFRLKPEETRRAVAELVEEGILLPAAVEGWTRPAFLHRDARRPRRVTGQALLAPFDPLVWERDRTERLFGFRYRIEIYTPVHKRVHGYYVLPFLLDERLVARVDLKADRQRSRLRVQAASLEPGAPPETLERLERELELTARWLGLDAVERAR
ncbi:MAG TPA: crosslink repair DNA glycosylase YcaQ family protein [Allosphingosinicella sp.]